MKTLAAALLIVLALDPMVARAVPVPGPTVAPQLAFPGQPIPTNGALAIVGGGTYLLVRVTARGAADVDIPLLQLSPAGGHTVYQSPPAPGVYDVSMTYSGPFTNTPPTMLDTFTVVDEVVLGDPDVEAVATLELNEIPGGDACCERLDRSTSGCTPSIVRNEPELRVELTTMQPPEVANQYMYRIESVIDGTLVTLSSPSYEPLVASRSIRFWEPGEEYCFRLHAVRLVDATEYLDLSVATSCLRFDDVVPRIREVPIDDSFLDHLVCNVPSDLLKERWCTLNEAACGSPSAPHSCAAYGYVCRGEPYPVITPPADAGSGGQSGGDAPDAGTAGFNGGSAGSGGSVGGGEGGASGMSNAAGAGSATIARSGRGGSCSVAPKGDSGSSIAWISLALFAIALRTAVRFTWLTVRLGPIALAALSACVDADPAGGHADPEPAVVEAAELSLQLNDGGEITAESLQCAYGQFVGSADGLILTLQYLSEPGHVAFAAYINNPVPGTPFIAVPQAVERFAFEAFQVSSGYYAELGHTEITVHLDALPPPASLSVGQVVRLNGRLEITPFSMDGTAFEDQSAVAPLHLAQGSVPIDCEAEFHESVVLD